MSSVATPAFRREELWRRILQVHAIRRYTNTAAQWGHVMIKMSGHPPFGSQIILNGHEYVACQAKKGGISFTKEGNCFTTISDAAGLGRVADTLSAEPATGHLKQVCERWIYICLSLALDSDEQAASDFRYQYSIYQGEYSRNLLFRGGAQMEEVFQGMIERTRARLNVKDLKTIFGARARPHRDRKGKAPLLGVAVETPTYDLTIFKLHFGKLTLKGYTKGERVLRFEAHVHNTNELECGRLPAKFTEIVNRLKTMLETFLNHLHCVDVSFYCRRHAGLPTAVQVGKTRVGGIDLNKSRVLRSKQSWRWPRVPEASPSRNSLPRCGPLSGRASRNTDPGVRPTT